MIDRLMHKRISKLLIIALLGVIISPLCHIKSAHSGSFIEICTSNGIERIALDSHQDLSPEDIEKHKNAPQDHSRHIQENCPVCAVSTPGFITPDYNPTFKNLLFKSNELEGFDERIIEETNLKYKFRSRAPPHLT